VSGARVCQHRRHSPFRTARIRLRRRIIRTPLPSAYRFNAYPHYVSHPRSTRKHLLASGRRRTWPRPSK